MDNLYRFGNIAVSCEGYDYPDDPYILAGSCGLEYTLDLTKEGQAQGQPNSQSQRDTYYGSQTKSHHKSDSWDFTDILMLLIVCLFIYAIYKTCFAARGPQEVPHGPAGGFGPGGGGGPGGNDAPPPYDDPPPPYGWRPTDNKPPQSSSGPTGSSYRSASSGSANAGRADGSSSGPGFWTGLGAGGLLGYLAGGNTNRAGSAYGYDQRSRGGMWGTGGGGSSWWNSNGGGGSGGSSGFGSGPSTSSGSSGTRTASGFGGTKRR